MLIQTFASLTELVTFGQTDGNHEQTDTTWAGGTLALARDLATYGWPDGAKLATKIAGRIADRIVAGTNAGEEMGIECDVTGAAYDPGAYYSGIPECWARPTLQPTKRAIRIVSNICASGAIRPATIQTRGLAVAALTLALSAKGYPVTVDVQMGASTTDILVRVIDAESGSQIDVDRIVYAMAHPTMFRQLFYAVTNHRPDGMWTGQAPEDRIPEGTDLFLGGAHLRDVERWRDGGEAWIISEYNRQTKGDQS